MPEDKMKIQKKELENVVGGNVDSSNSSVITCNNCKFSFENNNTKKKKIKRLCIEFWIYQCPKCKKWVYINGYVYKND